MSSDDQLCSSSYYNLLLHDLFLLSSFILSHPLYFSYFIFFSPYIVKLLSFLSPLFITTSLLLLPFTPHDSILKLSDHKPGFFLSTFLMIANKLRPKIDGENEDVGSFEDLDHLYKIVFDHTNYSAFDATRELPIEVLDANADEEYCVTKVCTHEVSSMVSTAVQEERKLANFLELLDRFEKMASGNVEDEKVDHGPPCPKSNKVARELQKQDLVRGSEATVIKIRDNDCAVKVCSTDNGKAYTSPEVTSNVHPKKIDENVKDIIYSNSWEGMSNSNSPRSFDSSLGSYGSMRKEREWKRTLACKLFEERHNGGGEEGMDSLWEMHEVDSGKAMIKKVGEAKLIKKNNRKKSGISDHQFYYDPVDEELDDEELGNGQICCLQALKLSSGKMNFGMGKPNLVKISKALKGIGWLHHVSRHGKKVAPRT